MTAGYLMTGATGSSRVTVMADHLGGGGGRSPTCHYQPPSLPLFFLHLRGTLIGVRFGPEH